MVKEKEMVRKRREGEELFRRRRRWRRWRGIRVLHLLMQLS